MEKLTLIHGDCLEVMPNLESGSIDALVTDPPFGIGFQYEEREDATTAEEYWKWLQPKFNEAMRLLKPGGLLAIWQAQIYFPYFWRWFGEDIRIYAAAKNFVQIRNTPINYGYDPIVMRYLPDAPPLRPEKPLRNLDWFVANTASQVSRRNNPERGHPCPRPLDQCVEVVRNFTMPGGIILDPFMGSGTIGVAALKCGRRFIGIEKERKYFEIASRRTGKFEISLLDCISKEDE